MTVLTLDDAEIHYQEYGGGYPLVLFAPGGMRSRLEMWSAASSPDGKPRAWNDWTQVLASKYRIVAMDQRNAGQSTGAIEADHGWHTYAADHLALMDHLGIDRFHVLGGCIGSSFCLKLHQAEPDRVSALVLQNPVGVHPDQPTYFQDGFVKWAEDLRVGRPELDADAVRNFGENMWGDDFVFSVSRDFVRTIDLPALVMPGNDTPHPAVIGVEVADILPGAERLMDWKGPDFLGPQHDRVAEFLDHHTPRA